MHQKRIMTFEEIEEQMKLIPLGNFYYADHYDTDDEMVIHLWNPENDTSESFDIRIPKWKEIK